MGLKKPESIAKMPLEEITSEPETLSNDQPPLKSTVIFNEFHQIINQKAIPIISQPTDHRNLQLTTKNIQSTTHYFNRPVLTTLGVLTRAVLTG